jgi:hypothetical protein
LLLPLLLPPLLLLARIFLCLFRVLSAVNFGRPARRVWSRARFVVSSSEQAHLPTQTLTLLAPLAKALSHITHDGGDDAQQQRRRRRYHYNNTQPLATH